MGIQNYICVGGNRGVLRIGICDDDEQFTIQLERHVLAYAKRKGVHVETQTFLSPDKLFSNIDEDGLFDILFLDIELDDITGIDVGNRLRSDLKNEIMQIVFISANDEYALQLFNIRPMNFLVKPITYDKVSFIMDEYDRLFPASNRYFTYNIRKKKCRISFNCILYFQSQGKKVQMVTQDGTEEFYGKLSDVVLQLNEQVFCVVHKSFVVNLHYVIQHKSDSVIMANKVEIPISQSMKQNVTEKLLRDIL